MSGRSSGSYLDRMLGSAVILLIAAIAIHTAVQLIIDIWVPLLLLASVIAGAAGALALRRRSGGW